MTGENIDKIKFSFNDKKITLREGENLRWEKRKLADLGSLWTEITKDNKLDSDEMNLFQKLDKLLNNNGSWNSSQMKALAEEFENSGQEVGDFLDLKLKEKTPKLKDKSPAIIQQQIEKPNEIKDIEAERAKKQQEELEKNQPKYDKEYVVKSGDSLSLIAKKILESKNNSQNPTMKDIMNLVYQIADANGIARKDIDRINIGQKLQLPAELHSSNQNEATKKQTNKEEKITPETPVKPRPKKPIAPKVLTENFEADTLSLNNQKFQHKTKLLDIAQDSLGLYEITYEEYKRMLRENPEELQNTQYRIIGENGHVTDQWCAHTVSYFSRLSGMDIGAHKKTVQAFINWAGKDYKSINTTSMTRANYVEERQSRADQIREQLPDMQEGDFIVWKANKSNNGSWLVPLDDGDFVSKDSSHIGFIEKVDVKNGIVTVIEGNANVYSDDGDGALSLVTNWREGVTGGQQVGEFQEVNKRDGLIRKEYTIDELAALGYSGYIDNSRRVV